MKALANFSADLAAQFRRRGGLAARLLCVWRYWAAYERGRLAGLSRDDSRLRALSVMEKKGALSPTAVMEIGDGLHAELDVFSAAFLAREILDDGTYRRPGFVPERGWTVVDVGAHQGLFCLDAARRVGPGGRVVAVEPFAPNYERLERNLKANGLSWVLASSRAAAEARGTRTLHATPIASGWQSLVISGADRVAIPIEAERLDDILAGFGVDRVDLIKIDVEGAWRLVFAGAPRLLACRPRLVMEVEGGPSEVDEAAESLRGLGYAVERVGSILFARAAA